MLLPCFRQIHVFPIPCVIVYIYFLCVCVQRCVYISLLVG